MCVCVRAVGGGQASTPVIVVRGSEDDGGDHAPHPGGSQFVTLWRSIGVCLFYGVVSVLISLVNKVRPLVSVCVCVCAGAQRSTVVRGGTQAILTTYAFNAPFLVLCFQQLLALGIVGVSQVRA